VMREVRVSPALVARPEIQPDLVHQIVHCVGFVVPGDVAAQILP
jgi:hypothetical protein